MFQKSAPLFLILVATVAEAVVPNCTTCPVNGVWGNWVDTTSCSDTCGFYGRKVQVRSCSSWPRGCPCKGVLSRVVPCPLSLCPTAPVCNTAVSTRLPAQCKPIARADDYVAPTCLVNKVLALCPSCPPGGIWTAWVNNSTCTATCGLCGTLKQIRTCLSTSTGCPCTGAATRNVNCPNKLCAKTPTCCNNQPIVKNLVTMTDQCGVQLPVDPPLGAVPACLLSSCGKCTRENAPLIVDISKAETQLLSEDFLAVGPDGCVVRDVECPNAVVGYGNEIRFNATTGLPRVVGGYTAARTLFRCNATGNGWETLASTVTGMKTIQVDRLFCYPRHMP